jgi:hypothetical protein
MTTTTGTTTQLVQPDFASAVELSPHACWYLVTVNWEYDDETYVMSSAKADAIAIDFTERIAALPRDEGFVVTDVKFIR